MTKIIKGFKVMNPDMTCRGFQYAEGIIYKHEGNVSICSSGFHFSRELKDCYRFYSFDYKNVVCEVETTETAITKEEEHKVVTSEIKIVRKLSIEEVLMELNLFCSSNNGSYNNGSYNRGSYNRGSYNNGSDNNGSDNNGSSNNGSSNNGSDNNGSSNRGSDNNGSYNRGSSNNGSDNNGSSNNGSYNRGQFNFGSHSFGCMNTISFIGTENNIACFDKPTKMTIMQFYRKYMIILKEIREYNFNNIYKLPNFDEEKWNLIYNYIY